MTAMEERSDFFGEAAETEPGTETGTEEAGQETPVPEPETGAEAGTEEAGQAPGDTGEDMETGKSLPETGTAPASLLSVSGNGILLPEGCHAAGLEGEAVTAGELAAAVEAVAYQTQILRGGILGLSILLGLLTGILLLHGFRLRRV